MKQYILALAFILLSFQFYAQCDFPFLFNTEIIKCDDDTADGITSFSINDINRYRPDSLHRTLSDANQGINALPLNFTNLIPYNDMVYARLDQGDCYETATVYLEVDSFPVFEDKVYEICESDYDGIATFYLESIRYKIQQESGNVVSFFKTMENAINRSNTLPLVYENTSNPQTIYMRSGFECYTIRELGLIVNNTNPPEINNLPIQFFCPTEVGMYDLTLYESQLVDDVNNLTFSYYNSFVEMLSETNAIVDPTKVVFSQGIREIFIRVYDNLSSCYSFTSMFFDFTTPCEVFCEEAYSLSFCQSRNDITYSFFNADGSPLTLEISNGTIDTFGFDSGYIIVRDSNGTELYNGEGTPTTTNRVNSLAGLVFQSTGSSITFEFYSIINACDDDPEIYIPIDINVYCSQNVGLLKLSSFLDDNADNVFDMNESNYSQGTFSYEKNGDGSVTQIVSSKGQTTVVVDNPSDIYEVSYELFEDTQNCFNTTTSIFNNISVLSGSSYTVEFPVTEEENCEDLAVYLINYAAPPRPGFTHNNNLVLENLGSATITSGAIEFLCDPLLVFNVANSVNPNYSINSTSTGFTLDFVNLQPGEVEYINISLTCPANLELGEVVTNTVIYITDENDNFANNNSAAISETTVGSYDPNDIFESHGPEILHSEFTSDDVLYYTIRFQNVGTANTINVSIDNTLDSKLDKSTIQMLSGSHDYVFTRTDNQLNWKFDNIHLPSESMDEPNSHGYVYYKIKPTAGFQVGDIIPNTAEIYFDFNAAVVTNTFETEFVATLSNENFNNVNYSIYPNPTNDFVEIKFSKSTNNKIQLGVYDIQGKLILEDKRELQNNATKLDVSNLKSGMYFLKVNDGIGEMTQKLIIN